MSIRRITAAASVLILAFASAAAATDPPGSPVLTNLLGSKSEIRNSIVGVDGTVTGSVGFKPIHDGNGVALKEGTAQVKFERPFGTAFPDAGTLEFWWSPGGPENTGSGSHFRERSPLWMTSDKRDAGGRWPEMILGLRYGCCGDFTRLDVNSFGAFIGLDFDLNFRAGDVFHLAITWDKSLGDQPFKLFIDGKEQAPKRVSKRNSLQLIDQLQLAISDSRYTYDVELLRRSKRPDGADKQIDPNSYIDSLMIFSDTTGRTCDLATGHCYQLATDSRSWHAAESSCKAEGGYLAAITSQAEQEFIADNLLADATTDSWIGAAIEGAAADWEWVTGESLGYENWDLGEPDNCNGLEHYAAINPDGFWVDRVSLNNGSGTCDCPIEPEEMSFICEWGDVPGDINGDSRIDKSDRKAFRQALGSCSGEAKYNAGADYDEDDCISYRDYRVWYRMWSDR